MTEIVVMEQRIVDFTLRFFPQFVVGAANRLAQKKKRLNILKYLVLSKT